MGKKLILMLLLLLALSGCGTLGEKGSNKNHQAHSLIDRYGWIAFDFSSFKETSWKISKINDHLTLSDTRGNASFKDGAVNGFGGCNEFWIYYDSENPDYVILEHTLAGCVSKEYSDQEDLIYQILFMANVYKIDLTGKLHLRIPDGESMILVPTP